MMRSRLRVVCDGVASVSIAAVNKHLCSTNTLIQRGSPMSQKLHTDQEFLSSYPEALKL